MSWWEKVICESEISSVASWWMAVGAPDDEDDAAAACCQPLAEPCGEVYRATFCAVFIKEYNVVAGLQLAPDELCLHCFLLVDGQGFSALQFWDDIQTEGHIVRQTAGVVVDEHLHVLVCCLSYDEQR